MEVAISGEQFGVGALHSWRLDAKKGYKRGHDEKVSVSVPQKTQSTFKF